MARLRWRGVWSARPAAMGILRHRSGRIAWQESKNQSPGHSQSCWR